MLDNAREITDNRVDEEHEPPRGRRTGTMTRAVEYRRIETALGSFVVWQKDSGAWHFEPDQWYGDEFSRGYDSAEAAEADAQAYAEQESAEQAYLEGMADRASY